MRILNPIQPAARARVDAFYLDPAYPRFHPQKSHHPGIDLNLRGTGGDADLGYPVVAMADGVVVHAQMHRVWGNIVLIEHPALARARNYSYLASQYAHLQHICVEVGQYIWAGEAIGSIGRGDPRAPWLAHLHFELRRERLPADYWPHQDIALIRRAYIDPLLLIQSEQRQRRFVRSTLKIYISNDTFAYAKCIVNLDDSETAHVRVIGSE